LTPLANVSALAAFNYPNFRYFITARILVTIASEMQSVAVGWQIYNMTHRPLDLGLVGLAQFAPGVLLFLVAGHTADRIPRQRILKICYGAFALCSLLLVMLTRSGLTSVWPIYAVLLLNGTVRAFNMPASHAFLPLLVPAEHFPNAVTWGFSIFQLAMVTGPTLGGLIYGFAASPIPVYSSSAIVYLGSLLLLGFIRLQTASRIHQPASWTIMLEGIRYIWRNKLVLGAISLDLFAVLLGGAVALLPVYAREILHTGPYGLGLLRGAPSAGAIVMAITLARWPLRRRTGVALLSCVSGFGVFTIIFGLSRHFTLSLIALALAGSCDMVSVVIRQTLVQLATPDEMRGRVSAVNSLFIGASNEFGQFESGLTAQWFGTVPAVILGGLGTIAVVLTWTWLFPQLRRVDQLPQ